MILKQYLFIMTIFITFHSPIDISATVWPTSYAYCGEGLFGIVGIIGGFYLADKYIKNDTSTAKVCTPIKKSMLKRAIAVVGCCVVSAGAAFYWIYRHTPAYLANQLIVKKQKLADGIYDLAYDKDGQRALVLAWEHKNRDYAKQLNLAKSKAQEFQEEGVLLQIDFLIQQWIGLGGQIGDLFSDGARCLLGNSHHARYPLHAELSKVRAYIDVMIFLKKISPISFSGKNQKNMEFAQIWLETVQTSPEYKQEQDRIRADQRLELEKAKLVQDNLNKQQKRYIKEEELRLRRQKLDEQRARRYADAYPKNITVNVNRL